MNRRLHLLLASLAVAALTTGVLGGTAQAGTAPARAAAVQTAAVQTATVHAPSHADTEARVPRIASAWAAAWNTTDPNELARLFTADGQYTDLAIGTTVQGYDQIAGWRSGTDQVIANVNVRITNAFRSGDQVAIETVYSGHIKGAPTPFAVRGTTILALSHGRIVSCTDNYNLAALLAQSGLPADWTPAGK